MSDEPRIRIEIDGSEVEKFRDEIRQIISEMDAARGTARTMAPPQQGPFTVELQRPWEFFKDSTFEEFAATQKATKRTLKGVIAGMTKTQEMDKYLKLGYMDRATRSVVSRIPVVNKALPVIYKTRMLMAADPAMATLLALILMIEWFIDTKDRFEREDRAAADILRSRRPTWDEDFLNDYIREHESGILRKLIPH